MKNLITTLLFLPLFGLGQITFEIQPIYIIEMDTTTGKVMVSNPFENSESIKEKIYIETTRKMVGTKEENLTIVIPYL